jgi:hypothetical protein
MKYIKLYLAAVFAATPCFIFVAFILVWFTFHADRLTNYIINNYTDFFPSSIIDIVLLLLLVLSVAIGISIIGTIIYFIYKKFNILQIFDIYTQEEEK